MKKIIQLGLIALVLLAVFYVLLGSKHAVLGPYVTEALVTIGLIALVSFVIFKTTIVGKVAQVSESTDLRNKYAEIANPAMITLLGLSFITALLLLWATIVTHSWWFAHGMFISLALFSVILSRRHKISEEPLEVGIVNVLGRDTDVVLLPNEWAFAAPFVRIRNKVIVPETITVEAQDVEIVLREGSVSGSGKVTFITDVLISPDRDNMQAFVAIGLMPGLKALFQARHQAGLLSEVTDKTWAELKKSSYAKELNESIDKLLSAPLTDGKPIGGQIQNINMKEMIPNEDIKNMLREEAEKVAENIEADTMSELTEKMKDMYPDLSDKEILAAIQNQQGRLKITQNQIVFSGSGGESQGDVTKAASLLLANQSQSLDKKDGGVN